jgi:putative FmdB family regulatory protein
MPTYDYYCTSCKHEFELVQRMTDPPRKRCPRCGRKVERKIGAGAGVIFKGSGFYSTDYRSSEYKAKEKAEKNPPAPAKSEEKSVKKESGTKPAKESG